MEQKHESVLLTEAVEALDVQPDDTVIDGTIGGNSTTPAAWCTFIARLIGVIKIWATRPLQKVPRCGSLVAQLP